MASIVRIIKAIIVTLPPSAVIARVAPVALKEKN